MPRKNYTSDWLGDEDELMDYYDENDSPAYCEDEEYFYDGHGMRHTSADMRSHCTDKPTSGKDVHGHSHSESQGLVETDQACVPNDNQAQNEPEVPDVLPEPLAAMLAGLRQLPTDGYRPNPPDARYTYRDDEYSSELNEMFSRLDILRTLGPDPVRYGYDSASSEPEEKEVVAESLESIETVPVEDRAQLAKTNRDGIAGCEKAKSDSCTKKNDAIKDAHQSFNAEIESMNEWYENIKAEEVILGKRIALHVRLPTNQVVTPTHNALVEEDVKEMMLIADSFKAVKTKKADIRATLKARIEKAEEVYDGECAAWDQQMVCLRNMAELSGIELDGEEAEDDLLDERVAQVIRFRSSTPAQSTSHAREPASSHARSKPSTAANADRRQKVKAASDTVQKDCSNCSQLREELRITLATITRLQSKAPIPNLRKFVKHGERILSELSAQRAAADETFAKEQQNELRSAEAASEDLDKEYARIKAIYIGIGDLWEHENEELWNKTYDLCRAELVRIKEEQKALENHSARDEEKVVKRQWDGEKMLMKQIKYYEAILKLAKSEVVSRWGEVGGLEDSDAEPESD
ncbi:hypothetical protein J4E85_009867 [Alternaria conjuncta]|uniref:uncharacterized protein n=1 Tax=Alternaria conjuncta TaxID=181017 RepID=UPI00221E9DF2|nr:uncharacterized protein J4E85_009867 [Alternaria conjuncta]KAI4917775.1 hypothetical protein J4E85_009867 [Alternaria conjuncta]